MPSRGRTGAVQREKVGLAPSAEHATTVEDSPRWKGVTSVTFPSGLFTLSGMETAASDFCSSDQLVPTASCSCASEMTVCYDALK